MQRQHASGHPRHAPSEREAHLVDRGGVVAELRASLLEPATFGLLHRAFSEWPDLYASVKLLHDLPPVCLVAMQLEHEVGQAHVRKPLGNHLESGGLLRHEEHGLVRGDELSNHVHDGLALPGARWSVHDEAHTVLRSDDSPALARIGIENQVGLLRRLERIQLGLRREPSRRLDDLSFRMASQSPYQRMHRDLVEVVLEVSVHRLLVEGCALESRSMLDPPAQWVDEFLDLLDDLVHRAELRDRLCELCHVDAERVLELHDERRVEDRIILCPLEQEWLTRVAATQHNREVDERRSNLCLAVGVVEPDKLAEGDVERPDGPVEPVLVRASHQVRKGSDEVLDLGPVCDDLRRTRVLQHVLDGPGVLCGLAHRSEERERLSLAQGSMERQRVRAQDVERRTLRRSVVERVVPLAEVNEVSSPSLHPLSGECASIDGLSLRHLAPVHPCTGTRRPPARARSNLSPVHSGQFPAGMGTRRTGAT